MFDGRIFVDSVFFPQKAICITTIPRCDFRQKKTITLHVLYIFVMFETECPGHKCQAGHTGGGKMNESMDVHRVAVGDTSTFALFPLSCWRFVPSA